MQFKLINNLKFVNVDLEYLKQLYNISSEVYYKENDYENKPYLGILLSTNNYKYVIPLTSAKEKHKKWKLEEKDRLLVYREIKKKDVIDKDIWIENKNNNKTVYQILSAIDLKKMIPVVENIIHNVNIQFDDNDTIDIKKYKNLLKNEYAFCVKKIDILLKKANWVYDKQTNNKKGLKFCCDFKALERFVDTYMNN